MAGCGLASSGWPRSPRQISGRQQAAAPRLGLGTGLERRSRPTAIATRGWTPMAGGRALLRSETGDSHREVARLEARRLQDLWERRQPSRRARCRTGIFVATAERAPIARYSGSSASQAFYSPNDHAFSGGRCGRPQQCAARQPSAVRSECKNPDVAKRRGEPAYVNGIARRNDRVSALGGRCNDECIHGMGRR